MDFYCTEYMEKPSNQRNNNPLSINTFPQIAHFLMIDRCNTKCIMCGGNYYYSKSGKSIRLETFKRMAENLRLENFKSVILAGAGDPLLNPSIIPITRYINESYPNTKVQITTNGIALSEEMARQFMDCKISLFNVSLNAATQESYKRIMQVDGFGLVCQNIQRLIESRDKRHLKTPFLQLSIPINLLNIVELPKFIGLAKNLGANGVNSFYTKFYPETIRHLNIDCEANKLKDEFSLFFHQDLSDQMVTNAEGIAKKLGIYFIHEPLFGENPENYKCEWPWTQIMIGFDGEIYPCGGGELRFKQKVGNGTYHFGNAINEKIDDFWNNPEYQDLRAGVLNYRTNKISECLNCANKMNPNQLNFHMMNWKGFEQENHNTTHRHHISQNPLVSVIVPTFNRPSMLIETLKSIKRQTYPNIEIVVINDNGADVIHIIREFNKDGTIKLCNHKKNKGLAAARNTGLRSAQGKYVAYLDDDDQYYPDHVETLVRFLEASEFQAAYTDSYRAHQELRNGNYVITKREGPLSSDFDYDRILYENFIPVLCFMHERACLEKTGYFDESLSRHEDWDLWIRLSANYKIAHLKKVTCEFTSRKDGSSMSSGKKAEFRTTCEKIFAKYAALTEHRPFIKAAQGQMRSALRAAEAMDLAWEGKLCEAITLLEAALEFDPHNAQTYNVIGTIYQRKGDILKAFKHFERAVILCSQNESYRKNLEKARTLLDSHRTGTNDLNHHDQIDDIIQVLRKMTAR